MTKGRRTASRILDAAEARFAARGFTGTSLRDIAAEAELQQPGLYKHFAGKDDIYRKVYERALLPLTMALDDALGRAPNDADFGKLTDLLTDVLVRHPNIPKLLLRALLAADTERDEVALAWLERLIGYGRSLSAMAGVDGDRDRLSIQIVATFNLLFGYFWTAPLLESLTGKDVADPQLVAIQKDLLTRFVAALGGPGAASSPA